MSQEAVEKHLVWHKGLVTYKERCQLLQQKGLVVWFTGLSGSGKSMIAAALEKVLYDKGLIVYHLDGDNIRHHLNQGLGFDDEDRRENIRRVTEVAALFKDAGLITLVSFISPHRELREFAKNRIGEDSFVEVYVKASLEACIKRDPKKYYTKALSGKIKKFTGISSDYEVPYKPELTIDSEQLNVSDSVKLIYFHLGQYYLPKILEK